jgi:hypothetical protein
MIQTILTFISAFLLSGIAGYYSIVGLALIFPGAFWPVVIMGGALEFSKLVTASWLYRNWKTSPFLLKSYLTTAVVVLMIITSMGIFGFLSKAHIEHATESAPIYDKVALYDEQISTKKTQIEDNKKAIKQMDESVDQLMNRTTDDRGANRAVQVRKSQQKERARLTNENLKLQKEIAEVNEQKSPIMAEMRKNEADIGPIKYVAELIYGTSDSDIVDKAVRLVIMIIMLVFDPLAVLLLIAGNISIGRKSASNINMENDIPIFSPTNNETKITKTKIRKPKAAKSVEVDTSNIATIYDATEKNEDVPEIEEIHQAEGLFTTQPKG